MDMRTGWIKRGVGILACVVLIGILIGGSQSKNPGEKKNTEVSADAETAPAEKPENKDQKIHDLIRSYYDYYASGDTKSLERIARPLTEAEKGFIGMFSEYVDSYENLSCYSKPGPDERSFLVSAATEIRFTGADTPAPGLDFFYVETDENGSLYINNLYCQYNSLMQETPVDPEVTALIESYESQDDVILLQNSIQSRYEAAVEADHKLGEIISTTIYNAYTNWAAQDVKEADASADTGETEAAPAEEAASEAEPEPESEVETETEAETETVTEPETESEAKPEPETETEIKAEAETEAKEEPETESEARQETAEKPGSAPFSPGEEIYIWSAMSVRMEMNTESKKVGAAHEGDTVKVIECHKEGWTEVNWKGKTGYIRTDLLEENVKH